MQHCTRLLMLRQGSRTAVSQTSRPFSLVAPRQTTITALNPKARCQSRPQPQSQLRFTSSQLSLCPLIRWNSTVPLRKPDDPAHPSKTLPSSITVTPIPITDLFANPSFSGARISPDGKTVGYLAPWSDRLNIHLKDISTGEVRRLTSEKNRNIEGFHWTLDSKSVLFTRDNDGDENWHLYKVPVQTTGSEGGDGDGGIGEAINLTPVSGARVMAITLCPLDKGEQSTTGTQTSANMAYIQMNTRNPALIDLHHLNIDTGEMKLVAENPGRFVGWIHTDPPHAILVAKNGDYELTRYDTSPGVDGSSIGLFGKVITTFKGSDSPFGPMPAMLTEDGKGLWIGNNKDTDLMRLTRVDLESGQVEDVDGHPAFDLDTPRPEADYRFASSLIMDPKGRLLGARYLGDKQVIHSLDSTFARVLEKLNELAEGTTIGHLSCDERQIRWVVEFISDTLPGKTILYDHSTGSSEVLGLRYPSLSSSNDAQLARVKTIDITARDGLRLPCHLTLPPSTPLGTPPHTPSRPLPTVLLVHGGPWYRDSAAYDPEVQFFASRGYAVLQVNFRGSTGYGKAHMQAGIHEFAGKMHDDLLDALDWAMEERIADRDRVAIYGCSYGGYASLVGATFTPERFAAAISYSGMSDLRELVKGAVPFVRETLINSYITYMGDPEVEADNEEMYRRSPVSRLGIEGNQGTKSVAGKCGIPPLLVIHGRQDVRVAIGQAEHVVNQVKKRGGEVDFLINEKEGHWFINHDSNVELYGAIERFLEKHLKDRKGALS